MLKLFDGTGPVSAPDLPDTPEVRLAAVRLKMCLDAARLTDQELLAAIDELEQAAVRREILAGR